MRIAEIESGTRATIAGSVRAAREPIRAGLTDRACVYWEITTGLGTEPVERGACPFWIEDESGKVLVLDAPLELDVRATRGEELFSVASADYDAISKRLREVKDALKAAAGDAKALHAEKRKLAKIATLVCSVRAHARGRVHRGGSLANQQRWIEANAAIANEGPGAATAKLAVSRWESALEVGGQIELDAIFEIQPVPPDLGPGGGYRDRPMCLVARPLETGAVRVRGVGALAPRPVEREAPPPGKHKTRSELTTTPPATDPTIAIILSAMVLAAVIAWMVWG